MRGNRVFQLYITLGDKHINYCDSNSITALVKIALELKNEPFFITRKEGIKERFMLLSPEFVGTNEFYK